jgi:RNA polymerase sigma factor (sigma-70 family)
VDDVGPVDSVDPVEPDVDLVERARLGDQEAAVQLWTRHYPSVLLAARRVTRQPRDAEEIASDAFAGMLSALASGAGPTTSVRAYLVTSVRNLAASRARRPSSGDVITDDVAVFDRATPDTTVHMSELELVRVAFADLPKRWQIVLWRTAVDKDSNIEVGRAMELSPNGVAALAKRARRGFRLAYLRAHLSDRGVDAECKPFVDGLADLTVSEAGAPAALVSHVATCLGCTRRMEELRAVDRNFAGVLGPAILGLFPSSMLAGGAGGIATGAAGAAGGAGGAGAAGGAAGTPKGLALGRFGGRPRWVIAPASASAVAVAIFLALRPAGLDIPTTGAELPTTTQQATQSPTTTTTTPPSVTQPPGQTSTRATATPPVGSAKAPRTSAPAPRPPTATKPPKPVPTATTPRLSPMQVDLGIRGSQTDTAITVGASAEGIVGGLTLVLEVPAGVSLAGVSGDWTSCAENQTTISCRTTAVRATTWAGTVHTVWAADAHGRVRATVKGTYANGSPAQGSIETTWPP